MARDGLDIAAIDPETGSLCVVRISHARMRTVATRSMGHAKECGLIVPQILQRPSAIFEGIRRDEDDDRTGVGWRCYCGIPDHAYASDGAERRPYPSQVYLVFVNDDRVAYNWRWEKCDPDDPRLPIDYAARFRRRRL